MGRLLVDAHSSGHRKGVVQMAVLERLSDEDLVHDLVLASLNSPNEFLFLVRPVTLQRSRYDSSPSRDLHHRWIACRRKGHRELHFCYRGHKHGGRSCTELFLDSHSLYVGYFLKLLPRGCDDSCLCKPCIS